MKRFWSAQVQYQIELLFQKLTCVGSWNAPRPSVLGVCDRSQP
jgi:hypothetical protein